jgi:ATP-binding cassette subfamily B protein
MTRSMRSATGKSQRNTMQHHDPVGTREGETEAASAALKNRLAVAENVLVTLTVDLDEQLRFASGLVALTDRRLIALESDGTGGANGVSGR